MSIEEIGVIWTPDRSVRDRTFISKEELFNIVKRNDVISFKKVYKRYFYCSDKYGCSLLHYANDPEIVGELLKFGLGPNCKNHSGKTPLFYKKKLSVIKMLLRAGADPNKQDNLGRTLLGSKKSINVIKMLLHFNADISIKDNKGLNPMHYARFNKKILKILQNAYDKNPSKILTYRTRCFLVPLILLRNVILVIAVSIPIFFNYFL